MMTVIKSLNLGVSLCMIAQCQTKCPILKIFLRLDETHISKGLERNV